MNYWIHIDVTLFKMKKVPEADGHLEMTVVPTPKPLLVDFQIKRWVRWSNGLHLIWLLIVHIMIQLYNRNKHFPNQSINQSQKFWSGLKP